MMEASEFIRLAEPDRSTTLDMVGDIIGPGYVPRGHEGGKPILVKEVECDDLAQDDSKDDGKNGYSDREK